MSQPHPRKVNPEDQDPAGCTAMEYAFRSLDPRDVRGDDINFYLTGKKLDNDAKKNADFSILQSMVYKGIRLAGGVLRVARFSDWHRRLSGLLRFSVGLDRTLCFFSWLLVYLSVSLTYKQS